MLFLALVVFVLLFVLAWVETALFPGTMNGKNKFLQAAFRYITWASPSTWRMFYFFKSFNILGGFLLGGVSVGPSWCCGVISTLSVHPLFFLVALRHFLNDGWWWTERSLILDTVSMFYCLRTACHAHVLITFIFIFAWYFDTVTLKKSKLYKVETKRGEGGGYFMLHSCKCIFVPKLFTFMLLLMSMTCAIRQELLTKVLTVEFYFIFLGGKKRLDYRKVFVGIDLCRTDCAVMLALICPLPLQPHQASSVKHFYVCLITFFFFLIPAPQPQNHARIPLNAPLIHCPSYC